MKKKLIAAMLAAALGVVSLAGCAGKGDSSTSSGGSTPAPAAESSSGGDADAAGSDEEGGGGDAGQQDTGASNDYIAGTQFEGVVPNESYNFPINVKSFQSTYWQASLVGMDLAAKELGVEYTAHGPNSESDIADQINMINSDINSDPPAIGLAACDATSVLDSLKTCADKGIPVVAFDSGVADAPEGSIVCTVATDNLQAGEVAAEHMYEAISDSILNAEDQVRIGEVNQDATSLSIQQRGLGFINKMISQIQADGKTVSVEGNEFYVNAVEGADEGTTDVVIEVSVPAQATAELCSTSAQAIMSKSDIIGIFGSNQIAAEGILAANANLSVLGSDASAGDVIGVGFDAGSIIKGAVEDGTMYGAVTQSPLMMGYYTVYALTKAANGDSLEDFPTDGYWYDASNMNDETIAPNLYE